MTDRELMKQALEALQNLQGLCSDADDGFIEEITIWTPEIINALNNRLAQPEQEPVSAIHIGWDYLDNGKLVATYAVPVPAQIAPKLYAAPPQRPWAGLTDEEVYTNCPNWLSQEQCKVWIKQIEAKLKEKNT